jgi:hypothetical protein
MQSKYQTSPNLKVLMTFIASSHSKKDPTITSLQPTKDFMSSMFKLTQEALLSLIYAQVTMAMLR